MVVERFASHLGERDSPAPTLGRCGRSDLNGLRQNTNIRSHMSLVVEQTAAATAIRSFTIETHASWPRAGFRSLRT
jgi:hypothetical protein